MAMLRIDAEPPRDDVEADISASEWASPEPLLATPPWTDEVGVEGADMAEVA